MIDEIKNIYVILGFVVAVISNLGVMVATYYKLQNMVKIFYDKNGSPAVLLKSECEKCGAARDADVERNRKDFEKRICDKIDAVNRTQERTFLLIDAINEKMVVHGERLAKLER